MSAKREGVEKSKIKTLAQLSTAEGVTTPNRNRSSKMNGTDTKPSLLASGYFIQVHPEIVKRLGSSSQAMVLQQLSYWLERSDNEYDGQIWVYNTYEDWSENLGLTPRQVRSAMQALEELGLIISCQPQAYDRTKWYTIDYFHVFWNSAESQMEATEMSDGSDKIGVCTNSTKNTQREHKEERNPEIVDLCLYLADAIGNRGLKPKPTQEQTESDRWYSEMRLLLEGKIGKGDTRENSGPLTSEQIKTAIDWAMNDDFWAINILSPAKLRIQYPAMRMRAKMQQSKKPLKGDAYRLDVLARWGAIDQTMQGAINAN